MPKPFTHRLIHKKEGDISTSELFRASDGMRIAVRQNQNVFFGENPNTPEIRYFMEQRYAVAFLRVVADMDRRKGFPSPYEAKELAADYERSEDKSMGYPGYLEWHRANACASIDDPKPFDSLIIDPYAGTDLARAN